MARHFANWLKAYVQHTSSSEAPDIYHFWTGVVTVAGALRRRVWIEQNIFQWVPNFYVIFVGPAGVVTKSTSINLGTRLLEKVNGIRFGPESMTWQALSESLKDATEYVEYIDNGGTVKQVQMSSVTCSISELGTFLRTDDTALVSFLTRMWDGQKTTFRHKTRMHGEIVVENPWLNVIAATTPAWMQNNFGENLVGEGLTSRIIFVYAEEKRKYVPYPALVVKAVNYDQEEEQLAEDLNAIGALSGPYELTPEALAWGENWYIQYNKTRPPHLSSDRFGGYVARKQTHLHKLAMVLAAAKRDALIIEKEDLLEAEAILVETEKSMLQVFESVGLVEEAKHTASLISLVKGYTFLTANELRRMTRTTMSDKDFKMAVKTGVEGGLLEVVERNGLRGLVIPRRTIN